MKKTEITGLKRMTPSLNMQNFKNTKLSKSIEIIFQQPARGNSQASRIQPMAFPPLFSTAFWHDTARIANAVPHPLASRRYPQWRRPDGAGRSHRLYRSKPHVQVVQTTPSPDTNPVPPGQLQTATVTNLAKRKRPRSPATISWPTRAAMIPMVPGT